MNQDPHKTLPCKPLGFTQVSVLMVSLLSRANLTFTCITVVKETKIRRSENIGICKTSKTAGKKVIFTSTSVHKCNVLPSPNNLHPKAQSNLLTLIRSHQTPPH